MPVTGSWKRGQVEKVRRQETRQGKKRPDRRSEPGYQPRRFNSHFLSTFLFSFLECLSDFIRFSLMCVLYLRECPLGNLTILLFIILYTLFCLLS